MWTEMSYNKYSQTNWDADEECYLCNHVNDDFYIGENNEFNETSFSLRY